MAPCGKRIGGVLVRVSVRVADAAADAAAAGDLVAVPVRPLADLREVVRVAALGYAAAAGPAGAPAYLASGGDVVGERFAQRVCVAVGEVDFVVAAVEAEGDGAALAVFDDVAGEVVDEVRGDFLHHGGVAFRSRVTSTLA